MRLAKYDETLKLAEIEFAGTEVATTAGQYRAFIDCDSDLDADLTELEFFVTKVPVRAEGKTSQVVILSNN